MSTARALAVDVAPPVSQTQAEPTWGLARLFAFRFAFAYLLLYNVPFPLSVVPWARPVTSLVTATWNAVVPWAGRHVLRLSYEVAVVSNGSGDKTYDYVRVFCIFSLALLAASIWTAIGRVGRHERLQEWLHIYLRYVLMVTMFSYGFSKVFKGQFPDLSPDRLIRTYGDSSPMGLLWSFMGYSTPYTVFSGLAEVVGGALLIFRRTTTLGALITAAVMTNVVMLNFCYDVPVKQYSSHLLMTALLLALPDASRLANLFLWQRPTQPRDLTPPFPTGRWRVVRLAVKWSFVAWVTYIMVSRGFSRSGQRHVRGAMYGAFEAVEWQADAPAWQRIGITGAGAYIVFKDGSVRRVNAKEDGKDRSLTLSPRAAEPGVHCVLTYTRPDAQTATLAGNCDGRAVYARLQAIDTSRSLLLTRGFNWINEFPFNR